MKPRYIAYIIWTVISLLGVLSWSIPAGGLRIGQWTLRWPTIAEVLKADNTAEYDTTWMAEAEDFSILVIAGGDTMSVQMYEVRPLQPKYHIVDSLIDSIQEVAIDTIDTMAVIAPVTEIKPVAATESKTQLQSTDGIDTRTYLTAFYQALDSALVMPIRVVHYGDSQIEEDRITDILRERWQEQYGGGGVGLLPLHQTVATRSIRQWLTINGVKQTTKGGPKRYLIYGPRSLRQEGNDYGMMGQVAVMDSGLVKGSDRITMHIAALGKKHKPHRYFDQIRVFADNISGYVLAGDTIRPMLVSANTLQYSLPDSTTDCTIHLNGIGRVYGVSLETTTGVMVDNIPMRGCAGTVFTRMNSESLINYFHSTNTRLIIMQYGGNMIPHTNTTSAINSYVNNLRQQVRHVRACAPYASILFIGPSDMSTRIDGKMVTYPMVPYLDRQLRKLAAEEQIAYWSLYDAMGGKNSMAKWVEIGLAASDYVHFSRAGSNKMGKALGEWIDQGKEL